METLQLDQLKETLLTPEEYSSKFKIALRTVYYKIQNETLKTIVFKGKKLIDLR